MPYSLLLYKICALGLFGGYVKWFRSYPQNRKSQFRVSGIHSSPFEVLSYVPEGSVPVFQWFINDLCDAVTDSTTFADDIKICRAIRSQDCNLLQPDNNSIQGCAMLAVRNSTSMKLN
jgi:hypothetical protein